MAYNRCCLTRLSLLSKGAFILNGPNGASLLKILATKLLKLKQTHNRTKNSSTWCTKYLGHRPRGCRPQYIAVLTPVSKDLLRRYDDLFSKYPFSDETIQITEELLANIEARREKWRNLLQETDSKDSSRKAWRMVKKFSKDSITAHSIQCGITTE